jgi:hypothetical protein
MNPYLILALTGLAIKLWASYRLKQNWTPSAEGWLVLLFLVVIFTHAILEITTYLLIQSEHTEAFSYLLSGYYAITTSILILLPFSISAILNQKTYKLFIGAAIGGFLLITYLITGTDWIIEDYRRLQYTITRVPGEHYIIFQTIALTSALFCISILIKSHSRSNCQITRVKSDNLMIGFIPLAALVISVIIAMQMGAPINASGIAPLLLSIYAVAMAENIKPSDVVDWTIYIPWSKKARLARKLSKPFRVVNLKQSDSKELAKEYEQALIEYAVEVFEDRKKAAAWLNVSQSKISKLIGKRKAIGRNTRNLTDMKARKQ